jgi:hypothetical protein
LFDYHSFVQQKRDLLGLTGMIGSMIERFVRPARETVAEQFPIEATFRR